MPSFDIVSKVDLQEVENAANQARKEVTQRYDLKGSSPEIEWDKEARVTITAADESKVRAIDQVLREKLAKRKVPLGALEAADVEPASNGRARLVITVRQGIEAELARSIVKRVKASKLKVQAQIQGDQLRVTGKKRDDLQRAIQTIREADLCQPLQFENFRD